MSFSYVWGNRFKKFIDNPQAIIPFIKKRVYYNFIADNQLPYYKDFKYKNYEETIDDLIENNKSLVRFGDELFDMLQGIGLYFGTWRQKYDPLLAEKMKEVISSHDPRLLVAFNPEFILKTKQEFKDVGIPEQYQFWTNSKMFLKDYYHKDMVYGSALCFNPQFNKHINFDKILSFFKRKHIIIVSSRIDRFKNVHLGITTDFIECPESDSWDKYDEIKQKVLSLIEEKGYTEQDTLILMSMSSAGKVLVYELTKRGYTSWDTGQFFDLAFKEITTRST